MPINLGIDVMGRIRDKPLADHHRVAQSLGVQGDWLGAAYAGRAARGRG
jgi:hypothetical protein